MPISIGFIMAFLGAGIGMIVMVFIFSSVVDAIDCGQYQKTDLSEACKKHIDTVWTILGIVPVALFFAIFAIFGGLSDSDGSIFDRLTTSKKKIENRLPLFVRILLKLRLAKIKNK